LSSLAVFLFLSCPPFLFILLVCFHCSFTSAILPVEITIAISTGRIADSTSSCINAYQCMLPIAISNSKRSRLLFLLHTIPYRWQSLQSQAPSSSHENNGTNDP
jgi:hypothetical protein